MRTVTTAVWTLIAAGAIAAFAQAPAGSFASPREAAQALLAATEHNDNVAMLKLFGAQGKDIVDSGDPAEDQKARAEITRRAHEKMEIQIDPSNSNRATIVVG